MQSEDVEDKLKTRMKGLGQNRVGNDAKKDVKVDKEKSQEKELSDHLSPSRWHHSLETCYINHTVYYSDRRLYI
jgi:hypothetical protein